MYVTLKSIQYQMNPLIIWWKSVLVQAKRKDKGRQNENHENHEDKATYLDHEAKGENND